MRLLCTSTGRRPFARIRNAKAKEGSQVRVQKGNHFASSTGKHRDNLNGILYAVYTVLIEDMAYALLDEPEKGIAYSPSLSVSLYSSPACLPALSIHSPWHPDECSSLVSAVNRIRLMSCLSYNAAYASCAQGLIWLSCNQPTGAPSFTSVFYENLSQTPLLSALNPAYFYRNTRVGADAREVCHICDTHTHTHTNIPTRRNSLHKQCWANALSVNSL